MQLLFLSRADRARGPIACGLARALFDDALVLNAAIRPAKVHPVGPEVLEELGVILDDHIPCSTDMLDHSLIDAVVTLDADLELPETLSHATRYHWPVPDPVRACDDRDDALRRFTAVRDILLLMLDAFGRHLGLLPADFAADPAPTPRPRPQAS